MPKLGVNKYQNYIHNSPVNDIESIKPIVHTTIVLVYWQRGMFLFLVDLKICTKTRERGF